MTTTYRSADGDSYRMDSKHPHESIELQAQEIAVVNGALQSLHQAGILPHTAYVRDPVNFRASVNVIIDGEGLEVSAR